MSTITTTERTAMLAETLAAVLAEQDGIHEAHALNRVDLAMRIVKRLDGYVTRDPAAGASDVVQDHFDWIADTTGTRPASEATRRLAATMWAALGGEEGLA